MISVLQMYWHAESHALLRIQIMFDSWAARCLIDLTIVTDQATLNNILPLLTGRLAAFTWV